jgi:hypothetical protein
MKIYQFLSAFISTQTSLLAKTTVVVVAAAAVAVIITIIQLTSRIS